MKLNDILNMPNCIKSVGLAGEFVEAGMSHYKKIKKEYDDKFKAVGNDDKEKKTKLAKELK